MPNVITEVILKLSQEPCRDNKEEPDSRSKVTVTEQIISLSLQSHKTNCKGHCTYKCI